MTQNGSLMLKAAFSLDGTPKALQETGAPHFNALEIDSLRQQQKASSKKALEAAVKRGAKVDPRIAALKAKKAQAK